MKRCIDMLAAAAGLAVAAPALIVIGLLIVMTSGRPIFFPQARVGRNGRDFKLYKFRTMRPAAGEEYGWFAPGDTSRVTAMGRILRNYKIDELPQLWNVVRGDMSLVGPRPEVRRWVEEFPERWAAVLEVRPGMTDPASIAYRNEEELLAASADPERLYREEILPSKLDMYEQYVKTRTLRQDMRILVETFMALARG